MNHAQHAAVPAVAASSEGIDLVITNFKIEPSAPSVRERIAVTIEVKNQGKIDLPADVYIPIDIRFEGMGYKFDQVSRNYKEGIKAGETVSINRNINGPWVGTISFSTDVEGEYVLSAQIDKANEIRESIKNNNSRIQKISFQRPADMNQFALLRAMRSYASVASTDTLAAIRKRIAAANPALKSALEKSLNDGWNFNAANLPPKASADPSIKRIRIKTIREAMKYDLKEFTVKPGQQVEIILENPDAMQHNLVITRPGAMEKVGKAGDAMMKDDKGAEKNYVPSLSEVLFSTPLVDPGRSFTLKFKAPTTVGDYPYVCTFPGHWTLMNGMMKVKN